MTGHRCPGPGCERTVPPNKLMCWRHWAQVPSPIQNAVYRAWDRGRGAGSVAHAAAVERAIQSITPKESSDA